ncbi:hypothetical protein [Salinicola sp. DM10]|uniref:gp53-like domain-containing protein n=1 Tax=Salinicola sp. DM10 TaxID=2815721 RepID=UPI001A909009|nr:hypothetical protein [Salinicola sp. DM10]MCE3028573.1 hypothetical protein [Salinicola sp. DM10]
MAIVFTITDAGRAALIDADHDGTTALTLSEIGFGRGRYTPSADQTALREPIKRLASMAGQAVAADTLHVSVQDESSDTYAVGEIGLFTDAGVLFAVYSQSEWIIEKAAPSTLLLATDLVVESLDVSSITFGDAAFLNPPATTEVAGVLELATQAEVDAGSDARRGVVPRTLKAFIDKVLAAYATLKQLNDHAASRNHPAATTNAQGMVELATYAETKEGSDNARAVTPAGLNARTATTTTAGLVEKATDAEAKAGTAGVYPDAAGVVAAFRQYGLGVTTLPSWPNSSFNDDPLNVPSGMYRLTSTTDGTPLGSGCVLWMRYNDNQYGTALFMPYSGVDIYTRSYRWDTQWSPWVKGFNEQNHRPATRSEAIAGTSDTVWATPRAMAEHVHAIGWGGSAPDCNDLMGSDFDIWLTQDFVGTTSGKWLNGPYGDAIHTGLLINLARTYNNGVIQTYWDSTTGEQFHRVNVDSDFRAWEKQLTDRLLKPSTQSQVEAGTDTASFLSPRGGHQLLNLFGLGAQTCPTWPLDDLDTTPTDVPSGLYRITSNFNRPGGSATVLWTRYNSGSGSMLLLEHDKPSVRLRGYGGSGWSGWFTFWNDQNQGAGSGLDADTVDGLQAGQFLRSDVGNYRVPLGSTSSTNWDGLVYDDSTDTLAFFADQDPTAHTPRVLLGPGWVEAGGDRLLKEKDYDKSAIHGSGGARVSVSSGGNLDMHDGDGYIFRVNASGRLDRATGGIDASLLDGQAAIDISGSADKVDGKHASDFIWNRGQASQQIVGRLELWGSGHALNNSSEAYGITLNAFAPGVVFEDRSTDAGSGALWFDFDRLTYSYSASGGENPVTNADAEEMLLISPRDLRYKQQRIWHDGEAAASIRTNGYARLPNGLLIQWGRGTSRQHTNFPIQFNNIYSVQVNGNRYTGDGAWSVDEFTTSYFVAGGEDIGTGPVLFIAIGN